MKPAIATQAIFAFVSSWNEIFLPLVLLLKESKKTLPVILILNYGLGETTIPMFVTTIPPVIVFLFLSKHIVEGVQLGSVKL
jgi:multiple sugar transport system permease protein